MKKNFVAAACGVILILISAASPPAPLPAPRQSINVQPASGSGWRPGRWSRQMLGRTENARRNGGVPSALLTAADKWISVDFTAAGGRGRGGAAAPPPPAPTSNKGTILD